MTSNGETLYSATVCSLTSDDLLRDSTNVFFPVGTCSFPDQEDTSLRRPSWPSLLSSACKRAWAASRICRYNKQHRVMKEFYTCWYTHIDINSTHVDILGTLARKPHCKRGIQSPSPLHHTTGSITTHTQEKFPVSCVQYRSGNTHMQGFPDYDMDSELAMYQ